MRRLVVLLALAAPLPAEESPLALLSSADPVARYRAAREMRALGERARPALPALVEALKDAEPFVRTEAARALVAIGITEAQVGDLVARLPVAAPDTGLLLAEALAGLGDPAIAALLPALRGKDDRARRAALTAVGLAGRHGAAAVPDLIDLLRHEDPATAKLAGEALRRRPSLLAPSPPTISQCRGGAG